MLITIANGGAVSLLRIDHRRGSSSSLFIVVLIVVGLITVPYLVRAVARFKRPETLLITSLGLCFALAMIAERLGYTMMLGAFLAGSLVAESGEGAKIEKLIEPVRQIFGAIFFVSVGMLIDPQLLLRILAWRSWCSALLSSRAKSSASHRAALAIGESPNIALKSGFAMAQIGVFAILIAGAATGGGRRAASSTPWPSGSPP